MRNIIYKSLFITAIIFFNFTFIRHCQGQWVNFDGPSGEMISDIAIQGNDLFVVSIDYGIFLTTDYGVSWKSINVGLNFSRITSIAVSGNNICAGTYNGVYRSSNYGMNWSTTDLSILRVHSIKIVGNKYFAATSEGLYSSSNNGNNWIKSGFDSLGINKLVVEGNDIYVCANDVYRSTNAGVSWTLLTQSLNPHAYISFASNGQNMVVGTYYAGLFYSTNGGNSWMPSSLYFEEINSLKFKGSNIYAAVWAYGVLVSSNYGSNWTPVNNGLSNLYSYAFEINDSNFFCGTLYGNIFRSINNGLNWNLLNHEMSGQSSMAMISRGSDILAGTFNGIYRSTDNGINWSVTNLSGPDIRTFSVKGTKIFAGGYFSGMYMSTDNGYNWNAINNGLTYSSVHSSAVFKSYVFTGTEGGLFRSSNDGMNWHYINISNGKISALAVNDTFVYAGTSNGLFISSDGGNSWTPSQLNKSITTLAVNNSQIYAGTRYYGVFHSTNNGTSWIQTSLNNLDIYSLYVVGNYIFAGVYDGIYLSTNNCQTWISNNQGFYFNSTIFSFGTNNNYLFAGVGGRGIWRRPISEIMKYINTNAVSFYGYSLEQNYPNPFNPMTAIRFQVIGYSDVSIKVYDVQGREVKTLVNETLQAGSYQTDWDASAYPSGVYFYRMVTNDFSETKRMMLIK